MAESSTKGAGALDAIRRIAADHGLESDFSKDVLAEVQRFIDEPGIDDPTLIDLTGLPFCTIDDARTRDLDQALCVSAALDGYRVWYAIADASWFVRPGTALFEEALRRGASFYLPGLMIPMLPRPLSEDLVSLGPAVDRRALVFDMRIDRHGRCAGTRMVRARMRSRAKLSFDTVQGYLDDPSAQPIEPPQLAESLLAFRAVGEALLAERRARDVVRYRRTEIDVRIRDDPMRFVIIEDLRNQVERYNEELSLLCNVEGARFLRDGDAPDDAIQPLYRVHPAPDVNRVIEFDNTVAALVRAHGLEPALWSYRHDGEVSLADYLRDLPRTPGTDRIAAAIHRQAMLMNTRSSFSDEPGGHHGIGADVYARFSAPMREIVGVFVHAEAIEKLNGGAARPGTREEERLAMRVLERANQAKRIQAAITKAANRLVLDQMFENDRRRSLEGRPWYSGTIIGIRRDRLYVQFDTPSVEVKVYLRDLAPELGGQIDLDAIEVRVRSTGESKFRLGDAVRVQVIERDLHRDRWKLRAQRMEI